MVCFGGRPVTNLEAGEHLHPWRAASLVETVTPLRCTPVGGVVSIFLGHHVGGDDSQPQPPHEHAQRGPNKRIDFPVRTRLPIALFSPVRVLMASICPSLNKSGPCTLLGVSEVRRPNGVSHEHSLAPTLILLWKVAFRRSWYSDVGVRWYLGAFS